MSIMTRTIVAVSAAALAGSALLAPPAVAAPDYIKLDAQGLEQTVLRAQPPKALGAWSQNIYGTLDDYPPDVCHSATGEPVYLPKAAKGGLVGYQVNVNRTAGVFIYQYADAAAAAAALAALRSADCPDSAKVAEDGPATAVPAQQSTDFTSAARTTLASSITYRQQGTPVTTDTRTTQRGLAVVQTEVTIAGKASDRRRISRAQSINKRWHRQVLAAYEAFGTGGSH